MPAQGAIVQIIEPWTIFLPPGGAAPVSRLSGPSEPTSSGPQASTSGRFFHQWQSLCIYLLHVIQCFLAIGIHTYSFHLLRHEGTSSPCPVTPGLAVDGAVAEERPDQHTVAWRNTLTILLRLWKFIGIASGVFLPGTLTLLQIDPVLNNLILRTVVISSFVFALESFISSCIYLSLKKKISSPNMTRKWTKASHSIASPTREKEFWVAISLPFSSMVWSLLWFMLAIFALAWDYADQKQGPSSATAVCLSGAWISVLVIVLSIQLWRALRTLFGSEDA